MRDIIIVGGGPAGFAAAIYASRAGLDICVIESAFFGGQMTLTDTIENYPGIDEPLSGYQLAGRMEKQAKRFGADIISDEAVDFLFDNKEKVVSTRNGKYESRAVIISMGTTPRKLGLPEEDRFAGAGVSYCATCDGSFFKGRKVAVIGGGDAAVEEALYLSRLCGKVYLVHRRNSLRAAKVLQQRIFENEKVEIIWDSVVEKIKGSGSVEGMMLKDVKTEEEKDVELDGIFVSIGATPRTDILKGKISLTDNGYIITDDRMRTDVPGVFAAGDIRRKALRQVVTAVSDGAVAAYSAEQHLNENKG